MSNARGLKNNIPDSLFQLKGFVYFCLFACMEPDFLKLFKVFDLAFETAEAMVLGLCLCRFALTRKIPKFFPYVLLFYLPMYLSTVINDQSLVYALQKTILCITFCMVIDLSVYYQGKEALKIVRNAVLILLTINLALYFAFPNGLSSTMEDSENYKMYFLGIKNGLASWLALGFVCSYAYWCLNRADNGSKKVAIYAGVLSILLAVAENSSTCIVGVAVMLLCMIVIEATKQRRGSGLSKKKTRGATGLEVGLVVSGFVLTYVGVVIYRIQESFSWIFNLLFGKDASFTGRTWLWDQSMSLISQSPFLGHGLREASLIVTAYGRGYTSHNFILESALSGGFLALAALAFMIFAVLKKVKRYWSYPVAKALTIGAIVFFVCTLTESGIYVYRWFGLLALLYALPTLCTDQNSGR